MTEKMLSRKEGRVGIMTFNNPEKHNAVSFEMWEAAEKILDGFLADPEVRVIVLTGAGGKAFVSGADISKFESERASEEAVQKYNALVEKVYMRIYQMPKPTIAMIRGYCIGGGLNLAICCDMRFSTENSKFALPAAKLGLGYGYQGPAPLHRDRSGPSNDARHLLHRAPARQCGGGLSHRNIRQQGGCPMGSLRPTVMHVCAGPSRPTRRLTDLGDQAHHHREP